MNFNWWKAFQKNHKEEIKGPHPIICLKCGHKQVTNAQYLTNCSSCHNTIRLGFKDSEIKKRPLLFHDRNYNFNVRCIICRNGFNPKNKYDLIRSICNSCIKKSLIGDESICDRVNKAKRSPFVRPSKTYEVKEND
jgi:hypothetical protein